MNRVYFKDTVHQCDHLHNVNASQIKQQTGITSFTEDPMFHKHLNYT